MIRFNQLNRWAHPANPATDPGTLNVAKNVDGDKEGRVSVRDGLQRPATWQGILATSTGLETTTGARSGTFGQAIRSLIPVDVPGGNLPSLTGES
jgi:hypothetical protein